MLPKPLLPPRYSDAVRRYTAWFGVVALLCLVGCSRIDPSLQKADEAAANQAVEMLRVGNLEALQRELSPSLIDTALPAELGHMQALFPDSAPVSSKQLSYAAVQENGVHRSRIVTEYAFDDGTYVLTDVSLHRTNDQTLITAFYARELTQSIEHQNRFTFAGKPFWNDLMLLLVVACGAFSLYACVACLRSGIRRKWLWALFCLIGFGQLGFNWTTSAFDFRLLWIRIPVSEAARVEYGPWYLAVSFPLGALVFIATRERLRERQLSIESAYETA